MKKIKRFVCELMALGGGQTQTLPGGGFHGGKQTQTLPGGGFHGGKQTQTLPGGGFHGGKQTQTLPGGGFHSGEKAGRDAAIPLPRAGPPGILGASA